MNASVPTSGTQNAAIPYETVRSSDLQHEAAQAFSRRPNMSAEFVPGALPQATVKRGLRPKLEIQADNRLTPPHRTNEDMVAARQIRAPLQP
jgi:hypothetical protein